MNKKKITTKKWHIAYVLLSLLGFITSCSPEYIPNMVNSPMLSNQGEFQATVATGTSNFDAQTAFAITDNIGIMVNGSYGNETNDSTDDFHKHLFFEGGLGYYDKIGTKGRYEIYGGFGTGKAEGYYDNALVGSQITDANYNRFFIQPGIGMSTGIFDGSFSPRVVFVQMNPKGPNFETGNYNAFIEPVITSKIGYKYVKFIVQMGASFQLGDQELTYEHQHFIFNFGINLNFGRKYYDL
jgi:hypothetical protein